MRSESRWRIDFCPEDLFWIVEMLFATTVAANAQAVVENRRRKESVGFSQRDLMSEKDVFAIVEAVVLAAHNPEVFFGAQLGLRETPGNPGRDRSIFCREQPKQMSKICKK